MKTLCLLGVTSTGYLINLGIYSRAVRKDISNFCLSFKTPAWQVMFTLLLPTWETQLEVLPGPLFASCPGSRSKEWIKCYYMRKGVIAWTISL